VEVNMYDFPDLGEGSAIPYGVYDVKRNHGFVNIGMDHDTAEFAVESLRRWWRLVGKRYYRDAKEWLICADGGGSNGSRNRAWKWHLHRLVDDIGKPATVCHYPPGTSKWNKIEHRLFSFISLTWKGQPLVSYETVVNLIGNTTTNTGLKVKATLDSSQYEKGVKVSDEEM
ncbi:MAG: ISAzo13 family transposase, partial [Candidatus Eisenbacteria bacterium]|nr:ISAzo13 family transposase [Candidatus Eisenbacteria bacterium]